MKRLFVGLLLAAVLLSPTLALAQESEIKAGEEVVLVLSGDLSLQPIYPGDIAPTGVCPIAHRDRAGVPLDPPKIVARRVQAIGVVGDEVLLRLVTDIGMSMWETGHGRISCSQGTVFFMTRSTYINLKHDGQLRQQRDAQVVRLLRDEAEAKTQE